MIVTLSKPTIAASPEDIKYSIETLKAVKSELGISGNSFRVHDNLTMDFGLQPIVRIKDLENLSNIEKNIIENTKEFPLALHAPYNYDNPKTWQTTDLSQGREGLETLLKIVKLADNIEAHTIAVHPNAIRTQEFLRDTNYTYIERIRALDTVINNVLEAQSHAKFTSVDLENKPVPATVAGKDLPIYTITMGPYQDMIRYVQQGGKLTFDTCHYGITANTFDGISEEHGDSSENITNGKLRELDMKGYFAEDYNIIQHSISEAMFLLRNKINHIHLNDGTIYRPFPETGMPNIKKRLPKAGGFQLYCEAYVPGKGELCGYDVIIPFLDFVQEQNRRVFLTLEVAEFDNDYKNSPRAKESLISMGKTIMTKMG